MQRPLHIKFAWKLLSDNSLWVKFFRAKYAKNSLVDVSTLNRTGSKF